jgi:hypothetical protein
MSNCNGFIPTSIVTKIIPDPFYLKWTIVLNLLKINDLTLTIRVYGSYHVLFSYFKTFPNLK